LLFVPEGLFDGPAGFAAAGTGALMLWDPEFDAVDCEPDAEPLADAAGGGALMLCEPELDAADCELAAGGGGGAFFEFFLANLLRFGKGISRSPASLVYPSGPAVAKDLEPGFQLEIDRDDVPRSARRALPALAVPVLPGAQLEVLDPVVVVDPVLVVNRLVLSQGSTDVSCHDEAMLRDVVGPL